MRTRNYCRTRSHKRKTHKRHYHKQSNRIGKRKSYKGGQARWPAPFNPAPPHPLPSVKCRFPNFRPLVLSQFGGHLSRRNRRL